MKNTKSKTVVLLDMHAILHRGYHALTEFRTSKGEPTGALFGFMTILIKLLSDVPSHSIVACFDLPGKTYRHEAYEEYKAGRKKMDDELSVQIAKSRDLLNALGIPVREAPGFEADDILGTLSTMIHAKDKANVVIASGDMDTLQLVSGSDVRVYTLKKGIQDTIIYNEEAVKDRFGFGPELIPDYKGLRGDPSDNIIGIEGIGEKTATTLITNFGSIEDIYEELEKGDEKFVSVGITPRIIGLLKNGKEEAFFSKMLATIRRDAPVEYEVPDASWQALVSREKLNEIFRQLEFRTMEQKLAKLLGDGADENNTVTGPEMSEKQIKELGLMLWLVDSNITSPTAEDIFSFTKAKTVEDARNTLEGAIKQRNLERVFLDIEQPRLPVIESMQNIGVKIDKNYLKDLSAEYHTRVAGLESEIITLAGMNFNPRSPKQLGEVLFEKLGLRVAGQKKTASGARSTKESELQKMRELHPIIPLILKFREDSKLLSTYIDVLGEMADQSGRLHAKFNQTGTTTGRLSSEQPNLQNIPARSDEGANIRNAFIAEEGYELVALDYSQIELRIAAFLSGDEVLMDIFRNKRDIHTEVASRVFHVEPEKVDKEMRRRAKVINFGILYGMGVNALKTNLMCERKEAQLFYDEYFKAFSGLARYIDEIKADAARKGYTETLFGRRRYFAGFSSPMQFVRAEAERQAINAPIQGTSADIIKLAMIRAEDYIKRDGLVSDVRLVMQIHDELVYEVKKGKAEEFSKKVARIMESALTLDESKGVPLVVHAGAGEKFGELVDIKLT